MSALGSAAQEYPLVLRAARSAVQSLYCPMAVTSCQEEEALKPAASRASSQAGNGRAELESLPRRPVPTQAAFPPCPGWALGQQWGAGASGSAPRAGRECGKA